MNRFLITAAAVIAGLTTGIDLRQGSPASSHVAYAEESWKAEFDEVCSRTQDAMAFSAEELKNLVARCDAIKPQIEKLSNESQRKVTMKRLQMCRDLFAFMLQNKESR